MPSWEATDPIVISYKDVFLRLSDLDTLAPGEWVNDAIISFVYQTFTDRFGTLINSENDEECISLWQPAVVELMCNLDGHIEGILPAPTTFTFLPVSDRFLSPKSSSTHWSLLLVTKFKSYHFDSLFPHNSSAAHHTLERFVSFYGLSFKKSEKSIREVEVPRQRNAHDCGVYLIQLPFSILNKLSTLPSPTSLTQESDVLDNIVSHSSEESSSDSIIDTRTRLSEWLKRWEIVCSGKEFEMKDWEQVESLIGNWENVES